MQGNPDLGLSSALCPHPCQGLASLTFLLLLLLYPALLFLTPSSPNLLFPSLISALTNPTVGALPVPPALSLLIELTREASGTSREFGPAKLGTLLAPETVLIPALSGCKGSSLPSSC